MPTYIVLGSSGGIGSELCRILIESGSRIIGVSHSEKGLQAISREGADAFSLDATDLEQVHECIRASRERFGQIDGIANCVGSLLLKPAHHTTSDEWQSIIATNLTSAFNTVAASAKAMSDTGGSIVLISSAAARIGISNHEAIAAAKAGIIGLTLSAAATYAKRGIRINCVAPGLVDTQLTSKLLSNEMNLNASRSMHPLGRIGKPNDVAKAIAWLLDKDQDWITGQVIGVDGGLASVRARS